jgi:phosphopantothenoylcysteine decarboxylase/phosphopantothenate--cysteine ligase
MGFAIAGELARNGATVELVAGPVQLSISHPLVKRTNVNTAEEMYQACIKIFPNCRAAVLSAAVADYRPQNVSTLKIKKGNRDSDGLNLVLVKNKDILSALGTIKTKNQLLVGFSLETHDEMNFAKEKLQRKNCDAIILNSLNDEGAGFSGDTNKVSILNSSGEVVNSPLKTKNEVAIDIVDYIISRYF